MAALTERDRALAARSIAELAEQPLLPIVVSAAELRMHAKECLALGLGTVPVRGKKSAVKWEVLQDRLPTKNEITKWFSLPGVTGLALILHDEWVRDFDLARAYFLWAEQHPEDATTMPTVRTASGFHVIGRWPNVRFIKFDDGELRSRGQYIVIPPSLHEDGLVNYRWVHGDFRNLPTINPEVLGLASCTEGIQGSEGIRRGLEKVEGVATIARKLALACVPAKSKQNHQTLITLTRHLLKIEWDLRTANQLLQSERLPTEIILQAFETWYSANKFVTHSRDDYLAEFLEAWQTVKIPIDGALHRIWAISQSAHTPRVALEYFNEEKMRLLVTFCRELQRARGDAPFFLSCRTVQQLFGLSSPREALRRLSAHQALGIISLIERGNQTGRATRWRYRPPIEEDTIVIEH